MKEDAEKLAAFFQQHLSTRLNQPLDPEYFYQSLPFCIIDAVYSIGVRYCKSVFVELSDKKIMNVVGRYCRYFALRPYRQTINIIPPQNAQILVSLLVTQMNGLGHQYFTDEIFRNRQRTSTRNGITKSEAVLRFAAVLQDHGVNYFQDVHKVLQNSGFESDIKRIPGQRSGISLSYFFMLSGSDNLVKEDRQIFRFLRRCLGKDVRPGEAQMLFSEACSILRSHYPMVSERLLDNLAWHYEREHRAV